MENIYAALLLHKAGKQVDEEGLKKVVSAAGIDVNADEEAKIKSLVASLKGVDIDKELENASLMAAAPASSEAPKAEKKEEKPKEEPKAAAAEGLSALFG